MVRTTENENKAISKILSIVYVGIGLLMLAIAGTVVQDQVSADVMAVDAICHNYYGGGPNRNAFCQATQGCFAGPFLHKGLTYDSKFVMELDYWYCKQQVTETCWWQTEGWTYDTVPCIVIFYYFDPDCTDPPDDHQYLGETYICDPSHGP